MSLKQSRETRLTELKRQLLEKTNKSGAIVFELQELRKSFLEMKGGFKVDGKDYSDSFENIAKLLGDLTLKIGELPSQMPQKVEVTNIEKAKSDKVEIKEIKISNVDEIRPKLENISLNYPKEILVSNLIEPEKFPTKMKVDWENSPKQIPTDLSPIKVAYKSLESVFGGFLTVFRSLASKITEYMTEPDKVTINDKKIVEYYGKRKVTYRIIERGNDTEVVREG